MTIGIGRDVPANIAAPAIATIRELVPSSRYVRFNKSSHNTIRVGVGPTYTKDLGVRPLTDEDFAKLSAGSQTDAEFRLLISSFYPEDKRPRLESTQ